MPHISTNPEQCVACGFCKSVCICYSPERCVGCLACYYACPHEAKTLEEERAGNPVEVLVDGESFFVPSSATVLEALRSLGKSLERLCHAGGCWSCAALIDGKVERTCIAPVRRGMRIETQHSFEPLRIVHGPSPHTVGGKATPWREVDYRSYVEAAIWVAGCNLRCPQCQNYHVTYDNCSPPMTPEEAAKLLVDCHHSYATKGVAISGGEPTLNRRWLLEFFRALRQLDPKVRKNLDSNGTLLTPDYIDALVAAGCNDFGVEPKCLEVETYMRITGLENEGLARRYLSTAWEAIAYLEENYAGEVYVGVGLVYNRTLVSVEELQAAAARIASINPELQVTVLDYFPAFRRRDLKRPSASEMLEVKGAMEAEGLKCVIVQTSMGHFGP